MPHVWRQFAGQRRIHGKVRTDIQTPEGYRDAATSSTPDRRSKISCRTAARLRAIPQTAIPKKKKKKEKRTPPIHDIPHAVGRIRSCRTSERKAAWEVGALISSCESRRSFPAAPLSGKQVVLLFAGCLAWPRARGSHAASGNSSNCPQESRPGCSGRPGWDPGPAAPYVE